MPVRLPLPLVALCAPLCFTAIARAQPAASRLASDELSIRVVAGIGGTYIHEPAFSYVRGRNPPRAVAERETDGGGLSAGGAVEVERRRWWGGVGGQWIAPVFSEGSVRIVTAFIGVSRPVGSGHFRAAIGPTLVHADREPRGFNFCLSDCATTSPPPLTTGGLGLTTALDWQPWGAVGLGIEGQLASGAQRFATGRFRVSVGR